MATMNRIDELTRSYAALREDLEGRVSALEEELERVRKKHMTGIKRLVGAAVEQEAQIRAAVEDSRALFNRPKTVVLHGIRVGYTKGKGKIEWDDEAIVLRLIKRHFPAEADTLIKTTERVVKDALASMSAADLKRIGVRVEETGEVVVVRPVDSDVDKIVKALLKDKEEPCEAAA